MKATMHSCVAVVVILASGAAASAQTIASTGPFNEDPTSKMPTSSTTTFFDPLWTGFGSDPLDTAQHELFHAIGFTVNYTLFNNRVFNNAGTREFRKASDASVMAKLTATTTHVDDTAGVVRGLDQKNSIMRPDLKVGQRLQQWDADILNEAFGWNTKNIKINVTFQGTWPANLKPYVNQAVTDVQTLFGSDGSGSAFAWTVVYSVPAPSTGVMLLAGIACAGRRRRR